MEPTAHKLFLYGYFYFIILASKGSDMVHPSLKLNAAVILYTLRKITFNTIFCKCER
jgi:hypothetical protein